MSRSVVKVLFLLVLPFVGYGCAASQATSSASTAKLEHRVPADPWENHKVGVCCFIHDDPPSESQVMVATGSARSDTTDSAPTAQTTQEAKQGPSQEVRDSKTPLAEAQPERPDASRQAAEVSERLKSDSSGELQNTQTLVTTHQNQADLLNQRDATIALLQKDQSGLRSELEAARAELAAKSASGDENARRAKELDAEKADLLRQLDVSREQLAAKATADQERANLVRQLEAANAELRAKRSVEKEKADLVAQLETARRDLAAKDSQKDTAGLAKQLEAANADLMAKRALETEKAELAAQLEGARRALSARDAQDKDSATLAKQLEAANAEIEKHRAAQRELALRLTQDKDDMDRARRVQGAQVDLSTKGAEEDRAAQLAKQLATAKEELAAKAALDKEREDLAKRLEDARAALAQKTAREQELNRAVQSMEKALKEEIEHGSGSVRRSEDSFTVELKDRILFDSGSASIKSDGLKVLKRIADSLKENTEKAVRVEGHTDDVPIRKSPPPRFRSNWELSAARAGNVAEYLEKDLALKPEQLSTAGYSFTRPVVPNESNAARAQNRRVEIIVTPGPLRSAMAPVP